MTSYLDRLNLRPFEKRLVVGVGAVLFVVLNLVFVVPHFSDLSDAQRRRLEALDKLKNWQGEIDQAHKYQEGIRKFIAEGQDVAAEDQVNQFARAIQNQQAASGVGIPNFGLSVWAFIFLGRLFAVQTPPELTRAVALCSILALSLYPYI